MPFEVTFRGRPIMDIKTPGSGIEFLTGGLEFQRSKAAKWAGIDLERFCERLDPAWQARAIALYLIDNKMEAILAQDSAPKKASGPVNQGQGQPPSRVM